MLDEKRTGKMIDRKIYRTSFNKWMDIYKWWSKDKIIEVKYNTRRKSRATTKIFVTQKQLKMMEILYTKLFWKCIIISDGYWLSFF